ncbi:type II toxin-antitoxin system RelE/ParE family toxin [Sandaracinobacteroides hominis]|uniref:type II toxin-antitoxin system RelE/ParE family toxin n=1 Tax=Sandaracinobacteroides hominis TaxID=2780086 RepID=UPI001F4301BC|nr:type II toxin-antitoxin system RelE/ParE family toxin [Sandaracinobacteroides hominis]
MLAIEAWIRVDDPAAAARVVSRIRQTVMMLGQFPKLGHAGDVAGTRELTVAGLPYRIVYRQAVPEVVDIVAIVDGRRRWP